MHILGSGNRAMVILSDASGQMMFRRENIERKIVDLQRMLASTDDQLAIALLKLAIESFESERDSLEKDGPMDAKTNVANAQGSF